MKHDNKLIIIIVLKEFYVPFIYLFTVVGEASVPDEHREHSGVVCEAVHHQRCVFCQRALSTSSELDSVQRQPALCTAREKVSVPVAWW